MNADGDGFERRLPRPVRCSGSDAGSRGFKGGQCPLGQTAVFNTASAGLAT